jgi:hypothetical protein
MNIAAVVVIMAAVVAGLNRPRGPRRRTMHQQGGSNGGVNGGVNATGTPMNLMSPCYDRHDKESKVGPNVTPPTLNRWVILVIIGLRNEFVIAM